MSDERLRQLERRWKETGAASDEAAYLLERVRTGELPRDRLALAAYLSHPSSRLALSDVDSPPGPTTWTEVMAPGLVAWCDGLIGWGPAATLRAAIACCRLVQPRWLESHPGDAIMGKAIRQLEQHADGEDEPVEWEAWGGLGQAMFPLEESAYAAAMTVLSCARYLEEPQREPASRLQTVISYASDTVGGPRKVHAAIRDALVPWALRAG